jgi:hypothetical protein
MWWLFRRRARLQRLALTRPQAMAARPIRNPSLAWHHDEEGNAVVILPRRRDLVGKLLAWFFMVPEARPLSLDQIGTMVWQLCDGEHSVRSIAQQLTERYKITPREAEVSLAEFLRRLARRGMVAFILPEEVARELTPEQRRALGVVQVQAATRPSSAAPPTAADKKPRPRRRRRGPDPSTRSNEEQASAP